MLSDLKFALRTLAKSPGFTAVAVLTLALAIGVNSAIFSIVNGVILRPLVPVHPEEVVNVFTARQDASHDYRQFSHAEFQSLRGAGEVFSDVAAVQFSLAGIGRDETMRRSFVFLTSENFFSLMGVAPAAGRFYTAEECRPNAAIPVVVASYAFWQRSGGRADFIGSPLRINGRRYTVIGVTPDGFSGVNAMLAPDLWLPLGIYSQLGTAFNDASPIADLASPKNYTLNLIARLQPGLTIAAAQPRLAGLAARLDAIQPPDTPSKRALQIQTPSRFSLSTEPETDGAVGTVGVLLMSMAGAVLLIASLNLANMLLARGTTRAKEIAIRFALGGSRWRVVRQLLAEGLLLAVLGGAAGLVLSLWTNDLLIQSIGTLFSSMNFSIVVHLRPDATVLGVTFLFCLLATLLFSLGPALKATKLDLVNDLKQQAGEPAHTGRFNRFFAGRHCLVMAQIALSLMLLFSAGLFVRGALKAGGLALGFDPTGGIVTEMDFTLGQQDEAAARAAMFAAFDRAAQLPGVTSAALATMVPYGNLTNTRRMMRATDAPATKADPNAPEPGANGLFTAVSTGYFDAVGVRLLRGRDFTVTESRDKNAPKVAIVDEQMAKELFPAGDALGQRIRPLQAPADGTTGEMEIVGIVSAHHHGTLDSNPDGPKRTFVPFAQGYSGNSYLHVRTAARDRAAVLAQLSALRSTLHALNPDLPVLQMVPFTDFIEKDVGLWAVRLGAVMFGVFGGIALLLAVVGVYGVKAYTVARRTREIGIRMAIGAQPGEVFALIMRQGALQTALAVAVGLVLALGVGQLLGKMLYRVSPADPFALGAATALLTSAALLACFLPARRATKINPIAALRSE